MNDMSKVVDPAPVQESMKEQGVLDATPKWEVEKVFKLIAPVRKTGGTQLTEITLRAPTFHDVCEVGGLPSQTIWADRGMIVEMNVTRFLAWLVRLSDLDTPTVYKIPGPDQRKMYEWLNSQLASSGN